jgi:hypothetical protein
LLTRLDAHRADLDANHIWSADHSFETGRAIRAGRRVRDEVRSDARTLAHVVTAREAARAD